MESSGSPALGRSDLSGTIASSDPASNIKRRLFWRLVSASVVAVLIVVLYMCGLHVVYNNPFHSRLGSLYPVPGSSPSCNAIRLSSFAYLIQVRSTLSEKWVRRSHWRNTAVISLSWKANVPLPVTVEKGNKLRSLYMPHSTWATGRNRLLEEAMILEQIQGWKFEFILFLDEDATLSYRTAAHPDVVISHPDDDEALRHLNSILIRDRPMRAGIGFNPSEDLSGSFSQTNFGCIRKCHMDPIVSAYHRTAVDVLLPYNPKYDRQTWYAAGIISDLYASAVIPSYCHVYQEVLVDLSHQLHHNYPKAILKLDTVYRYLYTCLSTAGFRDFGGKFNTTELKHQLTKGMGYFLGLGMGTRFQEVGEYPCSRQLPTVDYSQKLGTDIAKLWQHCLRAH
eukprot:scpid80543/ scgid16736/ 